MTLFFQCCHSCRDGIYLSTTDWIIFSFTKYTFHLSYLLCTCSRSCNNDQVTIQLPSTESPTYKERCVGCGWTFKSNKDLSRSQGNEWKHDTRKKWPTKEIVTDQQTTILFMGNSKSFKCSDIYINLGKRIWTGYFHKLFRVCFDECFVGLWPGQ